MRLCIKVGGRLISEPRGRSLLARSIATARDLGHEILLVHGGGEQLRLVAERLGLEERRHEGLRMTDFETARVATWVLAGEVNKALVMSLVASGLPAIGLCGADLSLFRPKRKVVEGVDLGFVGELDKKQVNAAALNSFLKEGIVPVLASMGPAADAEEGAPMLNVNADEAAGPIAAAVQADELIFLSDVAGVLDGAGHVTQELSEDEVLARITAGTIRGGMIPKVRAALAALAAGLPAARILSGEAEDPVGRALSGEGSRFHAGAQR